MKILIDGQTLLTADLERGIGTYFKNMVEGILEQDFTNEYYINVPDASALEPLSRWAQHKLHAVVHPAYHPQFAQDHSQAARLSKVYSETLNNDLRSLGIDLYWSPNALMSNVFFPEKKCNCKFAITIYDLAILSQENFYMEHWPREAVEIYRAKLKALERDGDLFMHISNYTQSDFRKKLKTENKKHVITLLAVGKAFSPDPFPQIVSDNDYVLYVGGFDPRKNMARAIEAFARLKEKYPNDEAVRKVELYLVCRASPEAERELISHARKLGIEDKIKLLGFLDDQTLISVYRKARCLFFPSLFEGFGLPVLEALACGLPVASSNAASLPEVGGEFATYFDPYDVDAMAAALYKVLHEPMDYESRCARYQHAKNFSWRKAAREVLNAFDEMLETVDAAGKS